MNIKFINNQFEYQAKHFEINKPLYYDYNIEIYISLIIIIIIITNLKHKIKCYEVEEFKYLYLILNINILQRYAFIFFKDTVSLLKRWR